YDYKEATFNDMSSFAEDAEGTFWIGTNGKGLLRFDRQKGTFTNVRADANTRAPIPDAVVSLLYTSDHTLWVGSYLEGLFKYDGKRFTKATFLSGEIEPGSSVWEVFEDSKGNIWIGTLNRGAFRYNQKTGELTNY